MIGDSVKVTTQDWGKVAGQHIPVKLITLQNRHGLVLKVTNYGCIVNSLQVPDRNGKNADVVLGYENLDKYLGGHPFFGAIAGRFANRIKEGRYELQGKVFQLEKNEQPTAQHLHGGTKGFDKYVWDFAIEQNELGSFVHFSRVSPDGESGYAGALSVTHTIGLDNDNQIHFNFRATTSKPTVVNLVNHSYYNLGGYDSGCVDQHHLKLHADFYTPVTADSIPTGEISSVKQTTLDFSTSREIGDGGFDHNFVLNATHKEGEYHYAAEVYEPNSGRVMTVLTTQPGVQFYNGFKLSNKPWFGRDGKPIQSRQGMCLETQHFPDSPNHSHFPTTCLNPGDVFQQKTLHRFSIK